MKNEIIVKKLLEYALKIRKYCENKDQVSFLENTILVEACVFNLSQMGELAKHIEDDFAKKHKEIPWKQLYGLRNRIVHDYEGVNLNLVWQIIDEDLTDLIKILQTF